MRKHVLYLGWVGFGNLGDDICRDLFIENINDVAADEGLEVDVTSLIPNRFSQRDLLALNPDLVVLGAGSLFGSLYLEPLILAQKHGIPTMIWGSGIDTLLSPATHIFDGPQGTDKQMQFLSHFSGHHADLLLRSVGNCTLGGLRGPDTLTLLRELGCDLSKVDISGDPGLLLPNVKGEDRFADGWSTSDDRPVVGVNWGTTYNKLYGGNEAKSRTTFAEALKEMADTYRFVLFSMWPSDLPELHQLALDINKPDTVTFLYEVPSQSRLTELLRRCLFTINLKLHANVFSAAVGCPFISVAYRSKCFDFAHSLEYGQFVMRTDAPDLQQAVVTKAEQLHGSIKTWQDHLKNRRERYARRLRRLLRKGVRAMNS